MKSFSQYISEEFVDSVSTRFTNDYKDVFKNPSKKELYEIMDERIFRAIILNENDVLCFPDSLLHYRAIEHFNLKDIVSLVVLSNLPDKDIYVAVTDSTKGHWFHNPEIKVYIKDNKYLNKMFDIEQISFFDEAIYGDWSEL